MRVAYLVRKTKVRPVDDRENYIGDLSIKFESPLFVVVPFFFFSPPSLFTENSLLILQKIGLTAQHYSLNPTNSFAGVVAVVVVVLTIFLTQILR